MSPEQVQGNWYNEKSDIWSLGCLTYELCALRLPFEAATQHDLDQKILDGSFARLPGRVSQELQRCVEWMLKSQPSSRPSARDLLGVPQAPPARLLQSRLNLRNLAKLSANFL